MVRRVVLVKGQTYASGSFVSGMIATQITMNSDIARG